MRPKKFKIKEFPNAKFFAGTECREPLKACYIEIMSTFQTEDDFRQMMTRTIFDIKKSVYLSLNKDIMMDKFLTSPNIPDQFYVLGRGYTKLEFTFYLKKKITLDELGKELNELCQKIYDKSFNNSKTMTFNKNFITKRDYAKK